jgi:hypothetical protein
MFYQESEADARAKASEIFAKQYRQMIEARKFLLATICHRPEIKDAIDEVIFQRGKYGTVVDWNAEPIKKAVRGGLINAACKEFTLAVIQGMEILLLTMANVDDSMHKAFSFRNQPNPDDYQVPEDPELWKMMSSELYTIQKTRVGGFYEVWKPSRFCLLTFNGEVTDEREIVYVQNILLSLALSDSSDKSNFAWTNMVTARQNLPSVVFNGGTTPVKLYPDHASRDNPIVLSYI